MQFPKPITRLDIWQRLVQGLTHLGDHTCHYTGNEAIMPCHCEIVDLVRSGDFAGTKIVSIAQTYIQNGDVMDDPSVRFAWIVKPTGTTVIPMTFTQHNLGIDREYLVFDGSQIKFNARMQHDLCDFVDNTWFPNLKEQLLDVLDK